MRARTIIRRTVWSLIALATFIALFYAEEDWRGARDWRTAQDDYAKAGKSLDYASFIPPPIPDDENLAALPLFTQEYAKSLRPTSGGEKPVLRPLALEKALREDTPLPELPRLGSYLTGKPADLPQVRKQVAAIYGAAFNRRPPPASALEQLDLAFPVIAELRDASSARPLCRFKIDYANPPFGEIPLVFLTDQIALARLMALHAVLALDARQPDVALADLRTIYILAAGEQGYPGLLGHLIAMALRAISESVVVEGLTLHAWNDAQLAQLQHQLAQVDYLRDFETALQGENARSISVFAFMKEHFAVGHTWKHTNPKTNSANHLVNPFSPWPAGWMDENAAHLAWFQLKLQATVDPHLHRVYVDRVNALASTGIEEKNRGRFILPWDMLFLPAAGAFQGGTFKSARSAVAIDQSILACALARYRLVHGAYPVKLTLLTPDYCPSIPHDVINGEPLRYDVLPGGGYRLYSIGSNAVDDGGILVFKKENPELRQIDFDQGDWVWFGPK